MAAHHKPIKSLELVVDNFGHVHCDGNYLPVKRFTWKNQNRVQVQAITYGATITSIKIPNKKGIIDDVILGFDDMKGYLEHQEYYFGVLGRFTNFIRHGHFMMNKKDYKVTKNMGIHHYNGGDNGFDKALWEYHIVGNKVILSHFSPDGAEGYPGDIIVFVTYELTSSNEFRIDIKAYSTKVTIVNISNSIFFNLAGHSTGPEELYKHDIIINADCVTVTNDELLPTGEIKAVVNTIYDFQVPVKIGHLLEKFDGFNTNFCINRGVEQGNCFATRLVHPDSGRIVEIYSNQYGLQFETGNNFPLKTEVDKQNSRCKNNYLKNSVTSFDLLDEIHNRVADVMNAEKSNKYADLLKFIKELQKKDNTVFRCPSGVSINSKTISNNIKRSKVNLQNLHNVVLTAFQVKYIEKILEKIGGVPEPNLLGDIREILEKVTVKCKNRDDISIKIPSYERQDDPLFVKDVRGKKGAKYTKHCAVCLMTQNYPDACNNVTFPSCVLKPGSAYHHTITYKFYVKSSNIGVTGYI